MPGPTKTKRPKARRGPSPTNERTKRVKKTPAPSPANRTEPCSTVSPDRQFSCDLPGGHAGGATGTSHTSADAGGRSWYKSKWIDEAEAPAANGVTKTPLERIDASWQLIIGEPLIAAASRPLEIANGGLLIETLTPKISETLSALHCARILEEVAQIDPSINRLRFRVKGEVGESMAMVGIGTKATVDGVDAKIVFDGTSGAPKGDEPKLEALLPSIAELEGRIGLAWDDLQDAEREKKRATSEHKDAQDHLNALVKELVGRTRGGKARQLALGEQADEEAPAANFDGNSEIAEAEPTGFAALPEKTLVTDKDVDTTTSLRHRILDVADHDGIPIEDAHLIIVDQLELGDLIVAPEDAEPTFQTCLVCGCTDAFGCSPTDEEPDACGWLEENLCDRKACVAA